MRNKLLIMAAMIAASVSAANKYDNPDTLFVARDGTAEFRNIDDAIEVCRAFMDYHKVIYIKKGIYKGETDYPVVAHQHRIVWRGCREHYHHLRRPCQYPYGGKT